MIIRSLSLILFLAIVSLAMYADGQPDNVNIVSLESVYKLKADKNGALGSVKVNDKIVYLASLYDADAVAYTSYGDKISIDKVSVPGAKPIYSQVIGEDVFYEDHRVCVARLKLKRDKPVTVEFERTIKDPPQFCEISFGSLYNVGNYSVVVEVPASLVGTLTFTPVNFPDNAVCDSTIAHDGTVTYKYILSGLAKIADEPMSPTSSYFRPFIRITGYFPDVAALYKYVHSYVQPEPQSAEIDDLARQLTSGHSEDLDKINAIATWVRQNIRYVAIEHGEYGQRPELAANVLANRYGDCKGSANLIKALLIAAGFDGRLVWIGTRDAVNTSWTDVPTLASGNHMIAACVIGDDIIFLDGTTDYSPAGYISPQLAGQSALVEAGDSFILTTVPYAVESVDVDRFRASYKISDDLTLSGNISHSYSGLFARMYDSSYHSITASRRDNLLHALAANGKKSVSVSDVNFVRERPDSPDAILSASVMDPSAVKRAGDRMLLSLSVIDPDHVAAFDTTKRLNPVSLRYPCRYESKIEVELPDTFSLASAPDDVTVKSRWFDCSVRYQLTGNVLSVNADLSIDSLFVPREQLSEWNADVRSLKKALNPVIKLSSISPQ